MQEEYPISTWTAFEKKNKKNKTDVSINLKHSCVLANSLRVTQRTTKRAILGVSLEEIVLITRFKEKKKNVDVMNRIAHLKWKWVGYVATSSLDRWLDSIGQPLALCG